jgi:hypothetical protein
MACYRDIFTLLKYVSWFPKFCIPIYFIGSAAPINSIVRFHTLGLIHCLDFTLKLILYPSASKRKPNMRHLLEVISLLKQNTYWKANSRSAAQEIPHLLWNWTVHYRVHKLLPLVILSLYLFKIHFNIILLLCLRVPRGLYLPGFLAEILLIYIFLISPVCYMPRPFQTPWFNHPKDVWSR